MNKPTRYMINEIFLTINKFSLSNSLYIMCGWFVYVIRFGDGMCVCARNDNIYSVYLYITGLLVVLFIFRIYLYKLFVFFVA